MDATMLMEKLPKVPRPGMVQQALIDCCDSDLGGELLIFARESYDPDAEIGWDLHSPAHRQWGSRCTCTACQEDFWAGWVKGGGLSLMLSEDETVYPGVPPKNCSDAVIAWGEGDTINCPLCGDALSVVHRKSLRSGRTHQLMLGSIEVVDGITVVMAWMLTRCVDEFGVWDVSCSPAAAVALLPGGKRIRYMHMARNGYGASYPLPDWRKASDGHDDPFQIKYYSQEAECQRKYGAYIWRDVPDLTGTTAEKTGLAEYVKAGGAWPIVYLNLYGQRPAVENLLKCGWGQPIVERIDDEAQRSARSGFRCRLPETDDLAFWEDSSKPRELLHMTKDEIRQGAAWHWGSDALALWNEAVAYGIAATGDAAEFNRLLRKYGQSGMSRYVGEVTDGWNLPSMYDIDRYLDKQQRKHGYEPRRMLGQYIDYWKEIVDQIRDPQDIELYPPDLRAAHDRIFAAKTVRENAKSKREFESLARKWAGLEWSDGEYCIRLPRSNGDLIAEGRTLHHCVGSYGATHLQGKLVFFVRHARRPERSWYTLNIDTTGRSPKRIQLHGYGNEYAHGKRLTIPLCVLDFVNRWEKEILLPVFDRVKAAEAKEKSKQLCPAKRAGAA